MSKLFHNKSLSPPKNCPIFHLQESEKEFIIQQDRKVFWFPVKRRHFTRNKKVLLFVWMISSLKKVFIHQTSKLKDQKNLELCCVKNFLKLGFGQTLLLGIFLIQSFRFPFFFFPMFCFVYFPLKFCLLFLDNFFIFLYSKF